MYGIGFVCWRGVLLHVVLCLVVVVVCVCWLGLDKCFATACGLLYFCLLVFAFRRSLVLEICVFRRSLRLHLV